MEYKLLLCESCEHLISVVDKDSPTFICPACGLINDRLRNNQYTGVFKMKSPTITCAIDELDNKEDEKGLVAFKLEDNIKDALLVLIEAGWVINFKGQN